MAEALRVNIGRNRPLFEAKYYVERLRLPPTSLHR